MYLTKVSPARNYKNVGVLNRVAAYIKDEFEKLNCKTQYQLFHVEGKEYKNVIASFGPSEGEVLVVGAHYDVAGDQPGADDNASAIASLLELARYLSEVKNLKYRVELVAYSLEEPPYFATQQMGSAFHVSELIKNNTEVKAMICLEMIGYFSEVPGSQKFPDESMRKHYPDKGNFIIVVGTTGQESFTQTVKDLMQQESKVKVESISLPPLNGLGGLSDHRNYWKDDIKAVMINDTSFLRNPNYHQSSDTLETLDFEKMTEVVKGICHLVTHLN